MKIHKPYTCKFIDILDNVTPYPVDSKIKRSLFLTNTDHSLPHAYVRQVEFFCTM